MPAYGNDEAVTSYIWEAMKEYDQTQKRAILPLRGIQCLPQTIVAFIQREPVEDQIIDMYYRFREREEQLTFTNQHTPPAVFFDNAVGSMFLEAVAQGWDFGVNKLDKPYELPEE